MIPSVHEDIESSVSIFCADGPIARLIEDLISTIPVSILIFRRHKHVAFSSVSTPASDKTGYDLSITYTPASHGHGWTAYGANFGSCRLWQRYYQRLKLRDLSPW